MNLKQFIELDDEFHLTPEDAQSLNSDLATRSMSDIPANYRTRVLEYLLKAFEVDSIEPSLHAHLNDLVSQLQGNKQ